MKKSVRGAFVLAFAFLFLLEGVCFVSASFSFKNVSLKDSYSPLQVIEGGANLTISDEDFIGMFSSNLNGSNVSLGDFFDDNGFVRGREYNCTPDDCSSSYIYSGASTEKTIPIDSGEIYYAGFVLTSSASNIEVTGLDFDLESDFSFGTEKPLEMEVFESALWEFKEFSGQYAPKNYGCYNTFVGILGPLVRTSKYCEEITLPDTDSLELGAKVDSADTKNLKMSLYLDYSGSELATCTFNPTTQAGCKVYSDSDSYYEAGKYYVCVSALSGEPTNYHLYSESEGTDCGFVYSSPENREKDYAIFASPAMFNEARSGAIDNLVFSQEELDLYVDYANEIINDRYGGDCSDGCVLPLAFRGVPQDLVIKSLVLDYKAGGEDKNPGNKIYSLEINPAKVDFKGRVDLGLLGFIATTGMKKFILYFDGDKILEKSIEVLPAPIVKSVSPTNPPAGVPVTFYAGVDFNGSIIEYKWDFGDASKVEMTSDKTMIHTYSKIGNYTVKLSVMAKNNLSNSASFKVQAVSPKDAVNLTLKKYKDNLENTIKTINKMPAWYQDKLEKLVDVAGYQADLTRLEKDVGNAIDESDYVDIAKELYALDVPRMVYVSSQSTGPLMTSLDEIDATPVQMISGGSEENLDGYKNPILRWQSENIDAGISYSKISMVRESGAIENLISVYTTSFKSNADDESYIVLRRDFNELFLNPVSDVRLKKEGGSSVVVLDEGAEIAFEFYYSLSSTGTGGGGGADETAIFVSPKLSSLVLEASIDTTCNSNFICEKSSGENSKTCRHDCKPIFGLIFYMILSFVFVLILYTVLQVWYKTRYESVLFKDKRQLYNLLMFIANARARGMTDDKIRVQLREKKWSSEKVDYALRKSLGIRTGMYEIIPVEKLMAYLRQKKANKNFATQNIQQRVGNINKPLMR